MMSISYKLFYVALSISHNIYQYQQRKLIAKLISKLEKTLEKIWQINKIAMWK